MTRRSRHRCLSIASLLAIAAACSEKATPKPTEPTTPKPFEPTSWTSTATGFPTLLFDDVAAFPDTSGGTVFLNAETGQTAFTIPAPTGGTLVLTALSARSAQLFEQRLRIRSVPSLYTTRVFSRTDGQLLFTLTDHPATRLVLGVVGPVAISALDDSTLVANAVTGGAEAWRTTIPSLGCTSGCGTPDLVDVVGGELLLARVGTQTASLVRVNATGVISAVPVSREVFRSSEGPRYAPRSSATAPVVIATDRALAALDPVTGTTRFRVLYSAIRPAGFFSFSSAYHLTRDGNWLSAVFIDSVGTAVIPKREIVLRTSDGTRVREREVANDVANDLIRGPCGQAGMVRLLNDLRVEYTDVASGRVTTSAAVAPLSEYRATVLTPSGLANAIGTVSSTHLVTYNRFGQPQVVGVRCAP